MAKRDPALSPVSITKDLDWQHFYPAHKDQLVTLTQPACRRQA